MGIHYVWQFSALFSDTSSNIIGPTNNQARRNSHGTPGHFVQRWCVLTLKGNIIEYFNISHYQRGCALVVYTMQCDAEVAFRKIRSCQVVGEAGEGGGALPLRPFDGLSDGSVFCKLLCNHVLRAPVCFVFSFFVVNPLGLSLANTHTHTLTSFCLLTNGWGL